MGLVIVCSFGWTPKIAVLGGKFKALAKCFFSRRDPKMAKRFFGENCAAKQKARVIGALKPARSCF
jgi:hypothetical protein